MNNFTSNIINCLLNNKNIETLIKAFYYLKSNFKNDLELVLLGKNGYGFDKISDEINNSSYKNDIKIIGWTEENEKIVATSHPIKMYLLAAAFNSAAPYFFVLQLSGYACGYDSG